MQGDVPASQKTLGVDEANGNSSDIASISHRPHKFLFGGLRPDVSFSTEQGGYSALDILSAGLKVSSGSMHQGNAFAAYLESSRPRPSSNGGDVAAYFSAKSMGSNANVFGINPLVSDTKGFPGQSLQNEMDFNVSDARTHVQGLAVVLNSNQDMSSPPTGFVCRVANVTKWDRCFWAVDGSADVAIVIGTKDKSSESGSMHIVMHGRDASGNLLSASVQADIKGSLILRSGAGDGAVGFQDARGRNTGYINSNGMMVNNSVHASSYGGSGSARFAIRHGGAGKGATASCDAAAVCDSFSGTILLKTGDHVPGAREFLEVEFPVVRNNRPNCNVTGFDVARFLTPQFGVSQVTKNSITLRSGSPLMRSSSYSFTYICAGT